MSLEVTGGSMDKYDEAIRHLTAHPEEILESWLQPTAHRAGCLFQFIATKQTVGGCLTIIRKGSMIVPAGCEQLFAEIAQDERLPKDPKAITVRHLPVFAEWQRRVDKEVRGVS